MPPKRAKVDVAALAAAPHPHVEHKQLVGFHAGTAGGVQMAPVQAREAGARAFAMFTRSARSWTAPALSAENAAAFKHNCQCLGFPPESVLPHGGYLINAGTVDPTIRGKSIEALVDEAQRCLDLGLHLYNFHPGAATGGTAGAAQACALVAEAINTVAARVPRVVMVVEMMAGQGSVVGSTIEEVAAIISGVTDKSRVGVCIDTAHIFGSGYDIRSAAGWKAFMADFEAKIGLSYLKGLHLNDSAAPLGSKKDRHWSIGHGLIGIEGFRAIMNDPRLEGLPLILETPAHTDDHVGIYGAETALLYSLVGTSEGAAVSLPTLPGMKTMPAVAAKKAKGGSGGGGKKKGKGAAATSDDSEDEDGEEDEEGSDGEEAAPSKGRGKAAAAGSKRGRAAAAAAGEEGDEEAAAAAPAAKRSKAEH